MPNSGIDGKCPYIGSIGWTVFPYITVFNFKSGKLAGQLSIYDLIIELVPDIEILAE
jgi:hypothetical protein